MKSIEHIESSLRKKKKRIFNRNRIELYINDDTYETEIVCAQEKKDNFFTSINAWLTIVK